MKVDLTVVAIPAYVGAMIAEYRWQRRHPVAEGSRAGDYEFKDTMASLSMGLGSLAAPFVTKALLGPLASRGRYAKAAMAVAVGTGAVATAADVVRRHRRGELADAGVVDGGASARADCAVAEGLQPLPPVLARIGRGAAVAAVATSALVVATEWGARTAGERLFVRTPLDLGSGVAAGAVAILGWDFIYYWNHRLDHEVRWMWAMHSVHHSSERYNLSTALRQPWAEALTLYVPYSLLAVLGVRPAMIADARAVNLIYQFWIHTEAIRTLGWWEKVLNTPSHHRAHHGVNREYLDRNHGSILIVWDKLFGTFEPEMARPVYGLTSNVGTFNPLKIFAAEWISIARDVAGADTWRDRWSFLLRGPGWAYEHRAPALG
ncbi:sterol desaturase family protein [Speluncibacter jeojiensis]|uniref:Sterol desaturase family protein n=1 Tax=Speluncibacter jeojiensis TaxID=2710754 RepID=A0A9X4RD26_9ACTN|nr:sterol desaturase family protein [Corynebacteriales bacterium D3-21]